MSQTDTLPVTIVTNGEPDLLVITLTSLLGASMHNRRLDISVVHHQCEIPNTPGMIAIRRLFQISASHSLTERSEMNRTYQQTRADEVRRLLAEGHTHMFMADGDLWIHPHAIGRMWNMVLDNHISCVGTGKVDVQNQRGYADWSLTPYRDLADYREKHGSLRGYTGCLFSEPYDAEYCEGNSLWNLVALRDSGVLETWETWPLRQRGYDLMAGLRVVEYTGIPAEHLSNPFMNGMRIALWHLNTGSDENNFDVTNQHTEDMFQGVKDA